MKRLIIGILALFVLIFVLALSSNKARAAEAFIEAGSTYIRGYTPVLGLGLESAIQGMDARYECSLGLVGPSEDRLGVSVRQNAYVQCLVWDGFKRFDLGLGVAVLQNADHYNGSRANFSLGVRYKFGNKAAVRLGHWSNAGTRDRNKGRDMLLIKYKL